MRRFPKFLKSTPTFFGLNFVDIGILAGVLYLATIFKIAPMWAVLIASVAIIGFRMVGRYVDGTALLLRKTSSLDFADETKSENQAKTSGKTDQG